MTKITNSIITSVKHDDAIGKINVSINQEGVTFSMPYSTNEMKLKDKMKCKITIKWDFVVKSLAKQWEQYDKQVEDLMKEK